jgi:hypothetical protein
LAVCAFVSPVVVYLVAAPRLQGALGAPSATGWQVANFEAGHPRRFYYAVALYRLGGETEVWRRVSWFGLVVDTAVAVAAIGFPVVLTELIHRRQWTVRTVLLLTALAAVALCWFRPVDRADGLSDGDQTELAIQLGEEWVETSRLRSK